MKTVNRYLTWSALTLFAASLTACGGGGGGSAPAGTATAGVSQGVITAKGSITVNGVKFETTGATIRTDDNPGTENDLKPGMVVKVKGVFDDRTGTATEIEFDDNLQGPISSVDAVNKTITVLGKVVRFEDNITRVNDDTPKVFGVGAANFTPGQVVEVSGFDDSAGAVRALRIDDRTGATEIEIKGIVSALGASSLTLSPAGGATTFTVNFSAPLPAGVANGSLVEVRGTLAGTTITALANARGVTVEDAIGAAGEKVEVEGLVTSGNSASFVINGLTVTTSGSTVFENGLPADIIPNVQVEAEGRIVGGVLQAAKVSFRSNIRLQALVTAKTGAGKIGTLTVLGKTITISNNTDFRNPLVDLDSITVGVTTVEVRGFLDLTGNGVVATRIDTANNNEFLMAPVTAANSTTGTLTMLGSNITVSGTTEFRNMNDAIISSATFFSLITTGPAPVPFTVVKVRLTPGTLLAEQAEIEGTR